MPQTLDHDTMTLAELAAANGPWLAVRLRQLAEHAGQALSPALAENVVEGVSRVLAQVAAAEGRPAGRLAAEDPAEALGREHALAHQQAGFSLSASLKVQRLLRRAYDDLVRESWTEKDTRARVHENVEHFFERALAGLVAVWTGHTPPEADPAQAQLLALREDQLRRTMEAAQKLTQVARSARERADALAAELEQVRRRSAQSLSNLKTEFTAAHARALDTVQAQAQAQALAERQALDDRVRSLEAERDGLAQRLAQSEQFQPEQVLAEQVLAERATTEASGPKTADNDAVREAAPRPSARARAAELKPDAGQAGTEAGPLRDELRQLRAAHTVLSEEAEAMRARLSETGSRLAAVRQAEGEENRARLNRATEELAQAGERTAALEQELAQARQAGQENLERIAELEQSLAAHLDERAREAAEAQARIEEADAQAAQLIAQLGEELKESARALNAARARAEEIEADALARAEAAQAQAQAQLDALARANEELSARAEALESERAEREDLAMRLAQAEAQEARLAKAEGQGIRLAEAQARAEQAEAEAAQLGEGLKESARALNAARARAEEIEAGAQARAEAAQAQAQVQLDALARANEELSARAEALESERAEREDLATRLAQAEAQEARLAEAEKLAAQLSGELAEAKAKLTAAADELAACDTRRMDAERRAADALAQSGEAVLEAKAQAKARLDELAGELAGKADELAVTLAAERDANARLLAAHLELSPDAVAAIDATGAFSIWNKRFAALFSLGDAELAQSLDAALPLLAKGLQQPEAFVSRVRELLASPYLVEDGMALTTTRGERLRFRCAPLKNSSHGGHVLNFSNAGPE